MFADASAIIAMITSEPEADSLAGRLEASHRPITSPVARLEAVLGVARKNRSALQIARAHVNEFLTTAGVEVVDITAEDGETAVTAYERYGRGRGHPARLNLGDCLAYAMAKNRGVELLYKGDDFARTDIGQAPPSVAF